MGYTEEQLNFFRMVSIIFDIIPVGLRRVFRQEWDNRYKRSMGRKWANTTLNGNDFYHKEVGSCRKEDRRLLDKIKKGNTTAWDSSCLFFAILFSNSIGRSCTNPLKQKVRDNVDALRDTVRNNILHLDKGELTDDEFENHVERVIRAFRNLGLATKDIETVKKQKRFRHRKINELKREVDRYRKERDMTRTALKDSRIELRRTQEENEALTQEINSKLEPFCSLAFTPPHEIIRRCNDIEKLTKKMQELYDGRNGAVSTIYLSGNPGSGKSQLARQLGKDVYSVGSHDTDGLIFVATLNAETLESLTDSYITLAKKLGITEYAITEMEKSKGKKPEETLKQVMRMISQRISKFKKWLMIADNVVDLALIRSYLPQTASKDWGHGQVLITTQDSNTIPSNAPRTYHQSLSKGMHPDDAVDLLKQVSQMPNQEHVEKVADVLEYQPLALAAAAFYVQTVVSSGSPNYSWTEYLEALSQGQREATEEPLANQSEAYLHTMTTTVKMAIERAVENNEVIRQAFSFLSLCASESITIEAVVSFAKARLQSNIVDELIRATILKSSLIVSLSEEDGAQKYLRLHNIVHEALKTIPLFDPDSTQKHHCIATAINVFESQLQKLLLTERYGHLQLSRFASHSKVLCRIALSSSDTMVGFLPYITTEKVFSWLMYTTRACLKLSDLSQGNRLSELTFNLLQYVDTTRSGKLLTSRVFETRGEVLYELCDYKSALHLLREALEINREIYGEEHGAVAANYNNIGNVYLAIGQHKQAKEFYDKALNIRMKLYGEEHGDVAVSYNNSGNVFNSIGQYSQAKEFHEKALDIIIKLYGEEHGDVAANYSNLGNVYRSIGQYNQAKEFYEKALNIRIKLYGEKNCDVAASYNNLGIVYSDIGQHQQAKEFYEKALNIRIKLYGEEHGDVAASYKNLGHVYSDIGQHSQAKECHEKALNIRIKLYGEEHGDVATSYGNLGFVYRDIGQQNQAKTFHEKGLNIGDVATSYNNNLESCDIGSEYKQAKEFYDKALNIRMKLYGEEHGDVATSYNSLGRVYSDIRQHNKAKELYEKALHIRIKLYGEENDDVATSFNNLGNVYCYIGRHNQAKEFHEKALNIRIKLYGEEHGDVARSYNNLGFVYSDIKQYKQAKEFYEKALNIEVKLYGEEHGDVAASYIFLGIVYSKIGHHNQAKAFLEKALTIGEKLYGVTNGDVTTSYINLGSIYSVTGQYNQAIEFYEKALKNNSIIKLFDSKYNGFKLYMSKL